MEKEKRTTKIILEKYPPEPYWRKRLNRKTDAIIPPQIFKDIKKLCKEFMIETDKGLIGKHNFICTTLPQRPRPFQKGGRNKASYIKILKQELNKNKGSLGDFKKYEELFVYLCVYLREKKYKITDIDNYVKPILDALKEFIGDDSKITTLIVEKKQLENLPKKDLDFFEQTLILICETKNKHLVLSNSTIL